MTAAAREGQGSSARGAGLVDIDPEAEKDVRSFQIPTGAHWRFQVGEGGGGEGEGVGWGGRVRGVLTFVMPDSRRKVIDNAPLRPLGDGVLFPQKRLIGDDGNHAPSLFYQWLPK